MDVLKAIEARYSVRKFMQDDIPQADIDKIITAAGMAPSGNNRQNWHFVIIRSAQIKKDMITAIENRVDAIAEKLAADEAELFRKYAGYSTFFEQAPVVVAVYVNDYLPENYQRLIDSGDDEINVQRLLDAHPAVQNIGAAIENMLLAATALGYGGCWISSINHSGLALEEIIGYHDEGFRLISLVPLGLPRGERKSPPKKPLQDIMTVME